MKIDNKGWGLNTLILMIGVVLIALLLITFFSIQLNSLIGKNNNKTEQKLENTLNKVMKEYYVNRSNQLVTATEKYLNDEEIEITSTKTKVTLETLKLYDYISDITDYETGNKCRGYTLSYKDASNITMIDAYLKCDNYETKGYGDN